MRTLAVNSNNDLYFGQDGNLAVVSGLESVKQRCEQAARILRTELPYAQSVGIPFFENPLTASPNLGLYEFHLRQAYTAVEDVTEVKAIRFKRDATELKYEAEIVTIYGGATISGNL